MNYIIRYSLSHLIVILFASSVQCSSKAIIFVFHKASKFRFIWLKNSIGFLFDARYDNKNWISRFKLPTCWRRRKIIQGKARSISIEKTAWSSRYVISSINHFPVLLDTVKENIIFFLFSNEKIANVVTMWKSNFESLAIQHHRISMQKQF